MEDVFNTTPLPLYPGQGNPVSILQKRGLTPGSICTNAENLAPQKGFNPRTVQPVWIRYADYAIPAHNATIADPIIYRPLPSTFLPIYHFSSNENTKLRIQTQHTNSSSVTLFR
jgi:hypothetical protein